MGLCCFYAGQYDLTLSCFERALMLADDDNMADVWYNIGQVAIGVGDLGGAAKKLLKVLSNVELALEVWLTKPSRSPSQWTLTTQRATTPSGSWS